MRQKRVTPELLPSAKRAVWRMDDHGGEGADKEFQRVRGAILEACGGQCAFCTLVSGKYQEVHHADDDHRNNAPENLFGACPLCHQVFHIGLAGMKESAAVIYAPEFTQAEINQIALLTWVLASMKDEGKLDSPEFKRIHANSVRLDGAFGLRRGTLFLRVSQYLKESGVMKDAGKVKISHFTPSLFANVLMTAEDDVYAKRNVLLGGIRMLPKPARFKDQIAYWRKEQDKTMPFIDWTALIPRDVVEGIIVESLKRVEASLVEVAATEV